MKRAFTLIELLVVVLVISLLLAIILPNLAGIRAQSRDVKRRSDLEQMALNIELYYTYNHHYPIWNVSSTPVGGGCLETPNNPLTTDTSSSPIFFTSAYQSTVPRDPSPNNYCYFYQSDASGANFKIAAWLEKDLEKAQNDGGTADHCYEVFGGPGGGQSIEVTNSNPQK